MILSKDQCTEIISWLEKFNAMNVRECSDVCHPAGLYKSRLDYNIAEVKRTEETQWIFDIIGNFLFDQYPSNTVNKGEFFYVHEFFTGGKFSKHIDKDRDQNWSVIVGAILNSDFEGGKLLTYNPDGELATNPGELYKMDSKHLHEVTEVTKGTRYSFVYFIDNKYLGLGEKLM
jgi:predicted 2-oxoglutarate/Fe(II)-dependent dioxygenase YbiX